MILREPIYDITSMRHALSGITDQQGKVARLPETAR